MSAPDGDKDWIVESHQLERSFNGHTALRNINLCIGRGEIFGILGPDGAGKTTLMQMLAAILDPTGGSCRVMGFDTVGDAAEITSRIGYMSQGFTLYDRLSVEENLRFAARIRGVADVLYVERRHKLLSMVGLQDLGERKAGELSGGMRKKLSLCTNLIHEPPLLMLDEPSMGVDPRSRRELWRMLHAYREQGITVVVSTPYMDEAAYCDRLAFLHSGELLALDTPSALTKRATGCVFELRTTRVGQALTAVQASDRVISLQWYPGRLRFQLNTPGLPSAWQSELEPLGRVQPVTPTLENAFVRLMKERNASILPVPPHITSLHRAGEDRAIVADGITVRFGSFTAVDNVSVSISAGEVLGWLGPNGAGKTTLIRVLCGLQAPVAGRASVAGISVASASRDLKARIGYMSQQFSLYPDLTVRENLAFFAGIYGLHRPQQREALEWAAKMTGLAGLGERRTEELSAPERQRLALACAVMHRPSVLFLDEPTSGVDPLARQRFWQLIQSLAEAGMAVLVTTHYLEEAYYCHRLGLMSEGRLIALGTFDELRADAGENPEASMEDVFMAQLDRSLAATPVALA